MSHRRFNPSEHDLELRSQVGLSSGASCTGGEAAWGNSPDTRAESASVQAQTPSAMKLGGDGSFRRIGAIGGFKRTDGHTKSYAIGSAAYGGRRVVAAWS